ncbi:MAG: hypothetical protein QW815_06025, partial [Nitrososphaerota archaeon]
KSLAKLLRERRRGSTALARLALDCFRELAHTGMSGERLKKEVMRLGEALSSARPSMPLVAKFSQEVVKRFSSSIGSGVDPRYALLKSCSSVEREYGVLVERLVSQASKILSVYETVITFSHSGTVVRILASSTGVTRVIVLESRPMLEGRLTARSLSRYKYVELLVDAAAGYGVQESDACIVGADAVFLDGSFAGKVGSLPLSLLCQKFGRPFYVACDLWKLCEKHGYVVEKGGPAEVWKARCGVKVRNPYFELVEPYLVTAYLTERGLIRSSDLATAK